MECKLLHGDCLELMQGIDSKSIDMILCDLPYGTTACKWDVVIPFEPLWKQYERIIKGNGAIVLTASQPFTSALIMSNSKLFKYSWVWEKSKIGNVFNCKNAPLKNYEDVCIFSKANIANRSYLMKYYPQGTMVCQIQKDHNKNIRSPDSSFGNRPSRKGIYTQTTTNYPRQIIKFDTEGNNFHPTQKPIALFEYLIKTYTNEGETVLDNCMGSGTTGVACKNLNRNFIGIEKDEKYFKIAEKRINTIIPQVELFKNVNQLNTVNE